MADSTKDSDDTTSIHQPVLILGEGIDEKNLFDAILKRGGINNAQSISYDGKDKLRGNKKEDRDPFLSTLQLFSGFSQASALGFTRDADGNSADAFKSARNFSYQSGAAGAKIAGNDPRRYCRWSPVPRRRLHYARASKTGHA